MGKFNVHKGNWREMVDAAPKTLKDLARIRNDELAGDVKRKLTKNKRLDGDVLKFALSAARDEAVTEKLKNGEPLDDREKQLMLGEWLLQALLSPPPVRVVKGAV